MQHYPLNPLRNFCEVSPTDFVPKFHTRGGAIRTNQMYAFHTQLTSLTSPTSGKDQVSPTHRTLMTSSMNIFLFLRTYNLAPVLKGEFYEPNAQEELGTFTPAAGSGRRAEVSREEERLSGRRTEVYLQAIEGRLPGRDGLDHAALWVGMAGRATGLVRRTATTAHFDASAGTTSHSFVVPVLLSSGKGEGDVSVDAGRDADRATQARQSASQEQQQEQVSAFVVRASGASLSSIESNFVDAREILARV